MSKTVKMLVELISRYSIIILAGLLTVMPYLLPSWAVSTDVLLLGLFALGYNVLFGHTGLLSFGHAVFWGVGAYSCGFFIVYPWFRLGLEASMLSLIVGTLIATAVGLFIAWISLKRRGVYMAMLTLAFNQMFFFLYYSPLKGITGGENGLLGVHAPPIFGVSIMGDSVKTYYFILIVFLLVVFFLKRILESPFGLALHGVRDNDERMELLGYNSDRLKLISFTLSAAISGLAGSLHAIYLNYVGLDTLSWLLSGEVIIMTLLGGMTTFYGPLVGTGLYVLIKESILTYTFHWQLIVGGIIVALTLGLRKGTLGLLESMFKEFLESK